jgi:hypothetical protein
MQIPIATGDDYTKQAFEVEWPIEYTKTPGLVIHKMVSFEGDKPIPFKKSEGNGYWWAVTHQSSGWVLWHMIPSNREAHEIAILLGELDWTVSGDEIKSNKAYGKLVKRLNIEKESHAICRS